MRLARKVAQENARRARFDLRMNQELKGATALRHHRVGVVGRRSVAPNKKALKIGDLDSRGATWTKKRADAMKKAWKSRQKSRHKMRKKRAWDAAAKRLKKQPTPPSAPKD
jgi:hypothetical protein